MTLFRQRSIRRRLTVRLLIGMLSFAVLSNGLLYLYLRGELIEEYDQSLVTEARAVASLIESEAADADLPKLLLRSFPRLHLDTDEGSFLQLWRADGDTTFRSPSLGTTHFDFPGALPAHRYSRVYDAVLAGGHQVRITTLPLTVQGGGAQPAGSGALMLGERRYELGTTLRDLAIALATIGGGLSLIAVALVVYGVRGALTPLDDFAHEVDALKVDTLAYRFQDADLAAELKPFAARLNDLLARLDDSFKRERRFSANVAHELRTPVAELRTMLDVATRWPPAANEVTPLHRNLLDVAERTSLLLSSLLDLHRHQGQLQQTDFEPLDVSVCIQEAWRPHLAAAQARSIRLQTKIESTQRISANRALFTALLTNLFQNVVSYATASSAVVVTVEAIESDDRLLIRVENSSHDVTADDLRYFDEPFWRKDHARSDRHHVGLGLSVVKQYALAMGMTCTISMPVPSIVQVDVLCASSSAPAGPAESIAI